MVSHYLGINPEPDPGEADDEDCGGICLQHVVQQLSLQLEVYLKIAELASAEFQNE